VGRRGTPWIEKLDISVVVPRSAFYRPLAPSGPASHLEAPDRCEITLGFRGDIANQGRPGLVAMWFDVRLTERRYMLYQRAATGTDSGLDVEQVRTFNYRPTMRQSLAGMVRLVSHTEDGVTIRQPKEDPLWAVALIYTIAGATGDDPSAAVAHDLHISRTAAAQRVRRARLKGYLQPTTKGKAR
jgi:hypothetical protein